MALPPRRFLALTGLCALLLSTPTSAQIGDALLTDSDLSVAGTPIRYGVDPLAEHRYGVDSSEVRRVLGRPIRRDSHHDSWLYDGLVLYFAGSAYVRYVVIVGRRYATRRGLRVGDPATRIVELYGRPLERNGALYRYRRAGGNSLGMAIEVHGDTVTAIRVGTVINMLGM
jgi:hypothetical protein